MTVWLFGPSLLTPGASWTRWAMVRPTGSESIVFLSNVVDTCGVSRIDGVEAVTVMASVIADCLRLASTRVVCDSWSTAFLVIFCIPSSSNVTR